MFGVRMNSTLLCNKLLPGAVNLPSAASASHIHHRFCTVDLNPVGIGSPIRETCWIHTHFMGHFGHVIGGISAVDSYSEFLKVVCYSLNFGCFPLRIKDMITTPSIY